MSDKQPPTRVSYELPATIKSIQTGWLATFQTAAVTSALLAVIESVLLSHFDSIGTDRLDRNSPAGRGLLVLSYLTFFFGASATFSSLLLTDESGEIHLRASRREASLEPLDHMAILEDSGKLMKRYGARGIVKPLTWHWVSMIFAGFLSFFAQLLVYIWITEIKPVAIALSCVAAIALLPVISILPWD